MKSTNLFRRFWRAIRHTAGDTRRRSSTATHGGMGERELQLRLELLVPSAMEDEDYSVFEIAQQLSAFGMHTQTMFLNAARTINQHSAQLPGNITFKFCKHGVAALKLLSDDEWAMWIERLTSHLQNKALDEAAECLRSPEKALTQKQDHVVAFADVVATLQRLVAGYCAITRLTATPLSSDENPDELPKLIYPSIYPGDDAHTDTIKFFLPAHCEHFATYEENFALYKAMATFLWAQSFAGTWWTGAATSLLYDFDDSEHATRVFQRLECLRLDAVIARELPGVSRQMENFGAQHALLINADMDGDAAWRDAAEKLQAPGASVGDTLELVRALLHTPLPDATLYQGSFNPAAVVRAQKTKIQEDETLSDDSQDNDTSPNNRPDNRMETSTGIAGLDVLHNDPTHPHNIKEDANAYTALLQKNEDEASAGEIPHTPVADAHAETNSHPADTADELVVWQPEWDYTLGRYRNDWCRVFFSPVKPGDTAEVERVVKENAGIIKNLQRHFEMLRQGDRNMPRQEDGDDIDINATVEYHVDKRNGNTPEQNIYVRNLRDNRDVCIVFIIDSSMSTGGWINAMEKKALLFLCAALEKLNDRYAIYGFSGHTRLQCNLHQIKSFDDAYGDAVKARIAGLQAGGGTRLGAAIRATGKMLADMPARTKIMITLSDGRPDDTDGYRGQYGIEDSRQALLEVTSNGIHPYCITINHKDNRELDYLDYMYGKAATTVVSNVDKLPFMMVDFYRRLTN